MSRQETAPETGVTGTLAPEDFARLFGISVEELPRRCHELIAQGDFRYRKLKGGERDRVILDALKHTDSGTSTEVGRQYKETWESRWTSRLQNFRQEGRDLGSLVPPYLGYLQPVLRLDQGYIIPVDCNFQLNWYTIFQHWLFTTYFKDASTVYEFGCGSGINLAALAKLYPDKRYVGLDWSDASRQIVNEMAEKYGWNMEGRLFDFFEPDSTLSLDKGSAVLTIGALEQTGQNSDAFLDYLLGQCPALCVHIEPVVDWYDENNLVDYAAIRYHHTRKYWEGFPDRLKALEQDGRAEIIRTKRSYFGTYFIEGYSQVIWRPTGKA